MQRGPLLPALRRQRRNSRNEIAAVGEVNVVGTHLDAFRRNIINCAFGWTDGMDDGIRTEVLQIIVKIFIVQVNFSREDGGANTRFQFESEIFRLLLVTPGHNHLDSAGCTETLANQAPENAVTPENNNPMH